MVNTRPPIVTVLGHVDHGKTSILDAVRHTSVQKSETGGITQHIGAYQVKFQDRLITFIDTPGHQAFSAMRARGGKVADLAILVVAADDGVMPQTKESITHINQAGIPFVVAINKIDIPDASPQKIKTQLAETGVLVEGFGGSVPVVEVSAKAGTNLDLLLETLLLLADLSEITADPEADMAAVVIESSLDRFKGSVATVIIKSGTLKVGEHIVALDQEGQSDIITRAKVRAMLSWDGQRLDAAAPSTPVQVLGFEQVPPVGSPIVTAAYAEKFAARTQPRPHIQTAGEGSLPLIIKSDVAGTLEAITSNLPPETSLIYADSGPINESDILLAQTTNSTVIGFRTSPTPAAKSMAKIEHIPVRTYTTIYDLFDDLKQMVENTRTPEIKETVLGQAKVVKIFDYSGTQVLGAVVTAGKVSLSDRLRLEKDSSAQETRVKSLRIGPKVQDEVSKDQECGIAVDPPLKVSPGDVVTAYRLG